MTESLLPLVCLFIALAPILCSGKLKVGLMLHTTFVPTNPPKITHKDIHHKLSKTDLTTKDGRICITKRMRFARSTLGRTKWSLWCG